jgi:hypothetical protein
MATVVGVTLVKQMTYRGDTSEEWSNQYWFTGSVPADSTAWKALYDALIVQEKTMYLGTCKVVRAYGYDSDADDAAAVNSYDYLAAVATVSGTASTGSGTYPAGDQAAWVRWKTSRLNTKGKPIFLRKYFHGVPTEEDSPSTADTVEAGWRTSALAFGAKLRDGSFLDARTLRSRQHAETLTAHSASSYITTRSLKRRGKRPSS